MAITYNSLRAETRTALGGASSFATSASITAASGSLLVAFIAMEADNWSANPSAAWTTGGAWTYVTRVNTPTGYVSLAMFVHTEAGGKTDSVTFTLNGGDSCNNAYIHIFELPGAAVSGGTVALGVEQVATDARQLGVGLTEHSISYASAMVPGSASLSLWGSPVGVSSTPRASWTEGYEATINSRDVESQYYLNTDTAGSRTMSIANQYTAGIIAEILAAQASGPASVTVGLAAVTYVGYTPIAGPSNTATPGLASVAYVGYAPTITTSNTDTLATPGVAAGTVVGYAPTMVIGLPVSAMASTSVTAYGVQADFGSTIGVAAVSFVGYAPTFTTPVVVLATPGLAAVSFVGYAPTISADASILRNIGVGRVQYTGLRPTASGDPVVTVIDWGTIFKIRSFTVEAPLVDEVDILVGREET